MANPSIQLYPSLKVFSRIWAYSFAYYSNSVLCMALFEPHPASHSRPVSSLPSKGSQANIHQGFVPHCYGGVKDTTVTLESIHSLIRSQADLMDGVSATVPLQWPPCLRLAPLDNSIYKTLCFWSHCINILACFLLCFFYFQANSEWVFLHRMEEFCVLLCEQSNLLSVLQKSSGKVEK